MEKFESRIARSVLIGISMLACAPLAGAATASATTARSGAEPTFVAAQVTTATGPAVTAGADGAAETIAVTIPSVVTEATARVTAGQLSTHVLVTADESARVVLAASPSCSTPLEGHRVATLTCPVSPSAHSVTLTVTFADGHVATRVLTVSRT